jgi:hypothetical protein
MRRLLLLFLLALLTQPTQPPPLDATWIGVGRARVAHGPGCLYRNATLYRCYDAAGVAIIGGPQTDGAFRCAAGDVFSLVAPGGAVTRAALRGVVRLPVLWL